MGNAVISEPRSRKAVTMVGDRYGFIITGDETDGAYAVFDFFVPPGHGSPPHIHTREDETFYVMEGELSLYVEGQRHTLGPGSFAHGPRNVAHYFRNEGSAPVHALVTVMPAGLEKFFAAVGAELPSADAPPLPPAEGEIEKLKRLAPEYGLVLLLGEHA